MSWWLSNPHRIPEEMKHQPGSALLQGDVELYLLIHRAAPIPPKNNLKSALHEQRTTFIKLMTELFSLEQWYNRLVEHHTFPVAVTLSLIHYVPYPTPLQHLDVAQWLASIGVVPGSETVQVLESYCF